MIETTEQEKYYPWALVYDNYDPKKEKSRESLLTIGNGYLGSRGALVETKPGKTNYPGTYIAGLYNRLTSDVAGKKIENEDFVNTPNWHHINFRINRNKWFDINNSELLSINRKLDFKTGVLSKEMVVKDSNGYKTKIISHRVASMANPHLLAVRYKVKPLNYSGEIELKSVTDGNIENQGVSRYNDLEQQHLQPVTEGAKENKSWLAVETTQSEIEVAQAAKYEIEKNGVNEDHPIKHQTNEGEVISTVKVELEQEEELAFEKVVAICTSKDKNVNHTLEKSKKLLHSADSFQSVLEESKKEWERIWDIIDIKIEGDTKSQMLIRLHLYHLMVTASPNNVNIDAGIPARGLHGEAYRGHIFWDELYILPLYDIMFPDVAKSILNYRIKRLEKARYYAEVHGYKGAMFPWQSSSDGREETQVIHLNPVSGQWGDDYSSLQRHISIAIAYNAWYYFQVTEDIGFMKNGGAEMFFEICRFWASKTKYNTKTGRYNISKVMGPDEFHEKHPLSPKGGLKNNAYTNIMVCWLFREAGKILEELPEESKNKITSEISLYSEEIKSWEIIAENLNIPVSEEGIIEQFEGYFDLKELDWDAYRKKYGNIYRLDRILKAEGESPDDYKLAKQADTLMTFYNLDEEAVTEILEKQGYQMPDDYLEKNYHYYLQRTSHGSTLSRVVHAYLANQFGETELGKNMYFEALQSDFTDIQGGTTAEGIHAGVMGGTVLMAITSFAGINLKKEVLEINPNLPEKWKSIKFRLKYKKRDYFIELSHKQLIIKINSDNSDPIGLIFSNKKIFLPANKKSILDY